MASGRKPQPRGREHDFRSDKLTELKYLAVSNSVDEAEAAWSLGESKSRLFYQIFRC